MLKKLLESLHAKYGDTWLQVEEPETIRIMFSEIASTDIDFNLFNALKTLLLTDTAWTDPFVFENIVDAIAGNPIYPNTLSCPKLVDIAIAYREMQDIKPNLKLSEPVLRYIAASAIFRGFISLPGSLAIANDYFPECDIDPSYNKSDQSPAGIQHEKRRLLAIEINDRL